MAKWVTFDLDGTLADSPFAKVVMPWLERSLQAVGIEDPREQMMLEQLRRFAGEDRVAGFHWDSIALTVGKQEQSLPCSIVDAMLGEELAPLIRQFPLYPDVPEGLASLKQRGYRLAIVTNGYASYQQRLFSLMGVDHWFDLIVGPDLAGVTKPDPRMFLHGELAGQVVMHVGDLLTQDIRAAREAGIRAVLIARDQGIRVAASGTGLLGQGDAVDDRGETGVVDDWFSMPPEKRPQEALASGWLDALLVQECRFLRKESPIEKLALTDAEVPDAIIHSFAELPLLLENEQ